MRRRKPKGRRVDHVGGDAIIDEAVRRARTFIKQINERYIERLCKGSDELMPAGLQVGDWIALSSIARERIAGFPVLLLNIRFEDPQWWKAVVRHETRTHLSCLTRWRECPVEESDRIELARQVLHVAWHTAHCAPAALFRLGIRSSTGREIAGLNFSQIDGISLDCWRQLHPRWAEDATFWSSLLEAACDADEERWCKLRLQGLQLLGRDLLRALANCAAAD